MKHKELKSYQKDVTKFMNSFVSESQIFYYESVQKLNQTAHKPQKVSPEKYIIYMYTQNKNIKPQLEIMIYNPLYQRTKQRKLRQ